MLDRSLSYVAKTRTQTLVPPRINDFRLDATIIDEGDEEARRQPYRHQETWNFEEEEGLDDFVVFNPSGSFGGGDQDSQAREEDLLGGSYLEGSFMG